MSGSENKKTSEKKIIGHKGVTLNGQARSIIYKVATFLREESQKDEWKVDIKRWLTRTAAATGVSCKTIQRILKEGKVLGVEEGVPKFVTPVRKKRSFFVTTPDSYDEEVIRRIIIDYYMTEKARPSLKVLHDKIAKSTSFPGGITSLKRIVQNLGFRSQNSENVGNVKRPELKNTMYKCYDVNCGTIGNWKTIGAHYEKTHDVSLSPVIYKFDTYSEFEAWKRNVEIEEGANYVAPKRKRLLPDLQHMKMFRCKPFSKSKDMDTSSESGDAGVFCPAQIKVRVENEQYEVSHISIHLGHSPQESVNERVLLEMEVDTTEDGNDGGSKYESEGSGPVIISENQDHDYHKPVDRKKQCTKMKLSLQCHLNDCNKTGKWNTLWEHYVKDHKLSVLPVTYTFETYSEFWSWKESVEEKEKVVYLSSWGAKESESELLPLTKTFRCNRSGVYDPPAKGVDKQRSVRPLKLSETGVFCPAHMKVTLEMDRVKVSHVSCHLGYNFDSGHFCLPSKHKPNYEVKLKEVVPESQILDAAQNGVTVSTGESENDVWKSSPQEGEQVDVIIDPVIVLQNQGQDFEFT